MNAIGISHDGADLIKKAEDAIKHESETLERLNKATIQFQDDAKALMSGYNGHQPKKGWFAQLVAAWRGRE